jgi:hypothetical protein
MASYKNLRSKLTHVKSKLIIVESSQHKNCTILTLLRQVFFNAFSYIQFCCNTYGSVQGLLKNFIFTTIQFFQIHFIITYCFLSAGSRNIEP